MALDRPSFPSVPYVAHLGNDPMNGIRFFDRSIRSAPASSSGWTLAALALALVTSLQSGCAIPHAIPADRLPPALSAPRREDRVSVDLTLLGQKPPAEHLIVPRDILGIYIEDIFGARETLPPVQYLPGDGRSPPEPAIGQPVEVEADGTIRLPQVPKIDVAGKTIPQVYDQIRNLYVGKKLLKAGKERITVSLIRKRTETVLVVREDTSSIGPTLTRDDSRLLTRRGSGEKLALNVYENDVLHALIGSGGLPGIDGSEEIWVLRAGGGSEPMASPYVAQAMEMAQAGEGFDRVSSCLGQGQRLIRIPLRLSPQEGLPFGPQDVILYEGDVVFVRQRETEYFLTGGLLNGAKIPLPRDHDVDVLEAIAIANGHINGPLQTVNNFVNGPGNIVPPSRVLVVRRWGREQQTKIEVDIKKALDDPQHRIIIQPGDLVILKYSPSELVSNVMLNLVNFNYSLNNN
jgi:hypothetical protein